MAAKQQLRLGMDGQLQLQLTHAIALFVRTLAAVWRSNLLLRSRLRAPAAPLTTPSFGPARPTYPVPSAPGRRTE
eukprot:366336-Chlamydomonas_euryale.AAC.31